GVTLQLKAVELTMRDNPGAAIQTMGQVQELARDSLREARARVWEMHDATNVDADLATSLGAILRQRTTSTAIDVSIATSGPVRPIPLNLKDAAFRIGREAVNNAVLHAEPARIDVVLEFSESSLVLKVSDDGHGFDSQKGASAQQQGHFGLSG